MTVIPELSLLSQGVPHIKTCFPDSQDAAHYHALPESPHTIMTQACLAILLQLGSPSRLGGHRELPSSRLCRQAFRQPLTCGDWECDITRRKRRWGLTFSLTQRNTTSLRGFGLSKKATDGGGRGIRNDWRQLRHAALRDLDSLAWPSNSCPQDAGIRGGECGTPFHAAA